MPLNLKMPAAAAAALSDLAAPKALADPAAARSPQTLAPARDQRTKIWQQILNLSRAGWALHACARMINTGAVAPWQSQRCTILTDTALDLSW